MYCVNTRRSISVWKRCVCFIASWSWEKLDFRASSVCVWLFDTPSSWWWFPFNSVMTDQVSNLNSRGISASYVGDKCSEQQLQDILDLFGACKPFYGCNGLPPWFKNLPNNSFVFVCAISAQMFVNNEPSLLDISFSAINSGFKQSLVFFWPPEIVSFILKSLFVN